MSSVRKVTIRRISDKDHAMCPWMLDWREADGKRHRRFFDSRQKAILERETIFTRLNLPGGSPSTVFGLKAMIDAYLSQISDVSPTTSYIYRSNLMLYGHTCDWPDSQHWTAASLIRFRRARLESGKSPATINKEFRSLNAFFCWARDVAGIITENPIKRLTVRTRRLREEKRPMSLWTPEQFAQVLARLPDDEWRLFILLLVCGVGRRGVVTDLRVEDIDRQNHAIVVRETKTHKTKVAPLHPVVWTSLERYLTDRPRVSGRLFDHRVFHPNTWKHVTELAAVSHLTMHHLRTLMSNWLQGVGATEIDVSRILDHSSVEVVRRYYSQPDVDARRKIVEKLPLSPPKTTDKSVVPDLIRFDR